MKLVSYLYLYIEKIIIFMSVKEFFKELNGNRVEGEIIKTFLYSLITSFVFLGILYFTLLKNIENFMPKYGFYLFFASLSYAFLTPVIRQVRAYKEFPCMSGMMIGMTAGMVAGFLPSLYIGSTNGMFIGAVFGMITGIYFGVSLGKCCGIMGSMEGIMAGFMGGLMGAMTAIMMLNDNLKLAIIISFGITSIILSSLNYMIFREMKENPRQLQEDHFITIVTTFVLIAITTWIMIYGPRSALFQ